MSFFSVKEDREQFIFVHPVNQELGRETLVGEHPVIFYNLVKVSDSLDSSFQETRL